jgi:hypothetical protein
MNDYFYMLEADQINWELFNSQLILNLEKLMIYNYGKTKK